MKSTVKGKKAMVGVASTFAVGAMAFATAAPAFADEPIPVPPASITNACSTEGPVTYEDGVLTIKITDGTNYTIKTGAADACAADLTKIIFEGAPASLEIEDGVFGPGIGISDGDDDGDEPTETATKLETVIFPETVGTLTIGDHAFAQWDNPNFKTVVFPAHYENMKIGDGSFISLSPEAEGAAFKDAAETDRLFLLPFAEHDADSDLKIGFRAFQVGGDVEDGCIFDPAAAAPTCDSGAKALSWFGDTGTVQSLLGVTLPSGMTMPAEMPKPPTEGAADRAAYELQHVSAKFADESDVTKVVNIKDADVTFPVNVELVGNNNPELFNYFKVDVKDIDPAGFDIDGAPVGEDGVANVVVPTPEDAAKGDKVTFKIELIPTYADDLPAVSTINATVIYDEDEVVVPPVTPPAKQKVQDRFWGNDRYGTSAKLLSEFGHKGADLFVASGQVYPDALTVSPAVSYGNFALVTKDGIPSVVAKALDGLYTDYAPEKVYVVGGVDTLSDTLMNALQKRFPTSDVIRIGGKDRYETSQRIAAKFFDNSYNSTAFIATGETFPDSLSAGAVAGTVGSPVLLVKGTAKLDAATTATLKAIGTTDVVIAGGPVSVNKSIENSLKTVLGADHVDRKDGATRYGTNVALNGMLADVDEDSTVWLASGKVFPDALSVSSIASMSGGHLYLAQPTCVSADVAKVAKEAGKLYLAGGPVYMSNAVMDLAVCR